ncbi:MAG: arginine--tRNA ligase [Phycisphaerae bacterium]|nr:arginine--tRNA ligase [Phycisphaerae bacterium]
MAEHTSSRSSGSASAFDPVQILGERFARAIGAAFPEVKDADPSLVASKNPAFGDFQCNAAMALGKALGRKPREVAEAIVAKVDLGDVAEQLSAASIAGPGFINVRLRREALAGLLGAMDGPGLGIEAAAEASRQTVVVDLCGVNLAKEMHVGHLRSTVIGDTLARVFERLGHRVIRQNHVGDWGLPIAMVTARVRRLVAEGRLRLETLTLEDLDTAYKAAKRENEGDARGLEMARRWHMGPKAIAELEALNEGASASDADARRTLLKLQAHDPEVYGVWERIAEVTMRSCLAVCARLNADVRAEHSAGESSYSEALAPMVEDLVKRGVAEESEGALVIRVEGIEEPALIRKSDGGFIYATTDIAAIRHRVQRLGADRVVYAVDARQSLHFKQVFGAAKKAGYTLRAGREASLEHAAFGMMLGTDGRPFKTRSGTSAKLADLLDDAEARAFAEVTAKNPALAEAERRSIARAVATAAIRYADLSTERTKDYVFTLERMVAFEGNTGPYLMYAMVRCGNILKKAAERGLAAPSGGGVGGAGGAGGAFVVGSEPEKQLALALLRYPGVVRQVGETLMPHRLCQYLYELSGAFSAFYDACHILDEADAGKRAGWLRLVGLTQRVLADGLRCLGVPLVERM